MAAILGTNQSLLEAVLLKRRVTGPAWLALSKPVRVDAGRQVMLATAASLPSWFNTSSTCCNQGAHITFRTTGLGEICVQAFLTGIRLCRLLTSHQPISASFSMTLLYARPLPQMLDCHCCIIQRMRRRAGARWRWSCTASRALWQMPPSWPSAAPLPWWWLP